MMTLHLFLKSSTAMSVVHSYLRYSTPEQRLGDSDRRQIARGQRWASENGFRWSNSYRDEGVSGYTGENAKTGDLRRLLDDIRLGHIPIGDMIWFENLDRLSRQPPYESIKLFQQIIDAGIPIIVDELGDNEEPLVLTQQRLLTEDHLLDRVYGELKRAHRESKRKSSMLTRTFANKRDKARSGEAPFMGKRCKVWLRLLDEPDPNGLWYGPVPERVSVINRIYELATENNGVNRIAEMFEGNRASYGRPQLEKKNTRLARKLHPANPQG
jgi:hypothetical protein